MFLMVVTRVKNKLLLLARLLLLVCLLFILTFQIYNFIKSGSFTGNMLKKAPINAVPVEQNIK